MKKVKVMASLVAVSALVLTACGSNEEATGNEPEEQEEQPVAEETNEDEKQQEEEQIDDEVEVEVEEENDDDQDKDTEENSSDVSTESMSGDDVWNPQIAEDTEGDVEVVYTAENLGYETDLDGYHVKVDGYQITRVTDMHKREEISFDGSTDGYIITVDATYENQRDEGVFTNSVIHLQMKDQFDYAPSDSSSYIADDKKMHSKDPDNFLYFEPDESVTGFVILRLTDDEYEQLDSINPKLIVGGAAGPNEDFSDSYREEVAYDFILSDEQGEQSESSSSFYQDKLVTNNMADKEMIYEEEGIGQSETIDDVTVTLEGVQYTEITPTESYEQSFDDFGDKGIVALTAKLTIDNQSDEDIPLLSTGIFLDTDDGRSRYMDQGMLSPDHPKDISAGETDEVYHVFLFRKDEFGLYETFSLEYGPFRGEDGKDLFKGHQAVFDVPAPE
ncbi:DUF5068 domain-containing protein [Alkalicoccobacillus plakortidis]|uniref:DUF5068 domain-containing protein n=1 Tax=Alkalicoccobacillus plakortidis TaxID=444060 RepID=A0ABT0XP14_9BACI|nr:DUF5068 domain-containing protein [Alkalicoccobacillus plakortidis]MCM2677098.1 DUF5068 domain-containing protein [Alkalicoccobacillus plakortidis]